MSNFIPSKFLRLALGADAASSAVMGVACAAGAGPLSGLLGLPEPLLRYAGLALLPWAAVVGFLATRETLRPAFVWAVIALNVLWAVDSFGLLFGNQVQPTGLGTAFIVVQSLAVLVLAECQMIAMRRSRSLRVAAA